MYKLIITDDEGKTTVVPLIRDEVTIGRKEGNTIRLTDRNISRFHARVLRNEDEFQIEDMGSLCGTKVNSAILNKQIVPISLGDKVTIGDYSLSIRTDVSESVPMGKQMQSGDETGIGKATPHARLVVLNHPSPGKEIDLTAELYVIGRSSEANCQIKDSSISRAHARMDLDAGEWTISDLDSHNGIIINGQKKDDYVLKAGDVVELGNVKIRFVAKGEPYEYDPSAEPYSITTPSLLHPEHSSKRKIVLAVVGTAIVIVAIAIAAFLMLSDQGTQNSQKYNADQTQDQFSISKDFGELMEKGKDAMQSENWTEAAKIFVLALRKNPDSKLAREFKEQAIREADSKVYFREGLAAVDSKDWKKAFESFSEIPRSSQYYDENQLKYVTGAFCSDLVTKTRNTIEKGEWASARGNLTKIDSIEDAPSECKKDAADLKSFLAALNPDAGSNQNDNSTSIKPRRVGKPRQGNRKNNLQRPMNPYGS